MQRRFMGTDIEVGAGVFAPRSETELLCREAIAALAGVPDPLVIDLCCGSGNILLAMAKALPGLRGFGGDVLSQSIACARKNVSKLGVGERVTFAAGDLFDAFAAYDLHRKADLVVCNPPYISTHRLASASAALLEGEPREAFDAGPYGLAVHQRLINEAWRYLRPGGWLAFEFGDGQARQIELLLRRSRAYGVPRFGLDTSGTPRVAIVQPRALPESSALADDLAPGAFVPEPV